MLEHSEHDHSDRGTQSRHFLRGRQTVENRHIHVQQGHVHGLFGELAQCLASVFSDCDHVNAVLLVQQIGQPLANDYIVISKKNTNRFTHQGSPSLGSV